MFERLMAGAMLCFGCVPRAPPNERAIRYNHECVEAMSRGRLEEAEALCDHSLEFCEYFGDALTNKGLLRRAAGDREGARKFFIKALRENREQAQAANNLGVLHLEDGAYGEAEARFKQALVNNPDYAEARWNLAGALLGQGKLREAERAYRQLVISAPLVTDGRLGLGRVLFKQRRFRDALIEFEHATLLEPSRAESWLLLGATQLELGHADSARASLARCLDEAPDDQRCRQLHDDP